MSTLLSPPTARAFAPVPFAVPHVPLGAMKHRPALRARARAGHAGHATLGRRLSELRSEVADANPPAPTDEEVDPGVVEGTDLRVLKYPHPSLRAPDAEVTEFDAELKQTLKEMFLVMYASKGVGLAAPQVGINKRIMVFNPEGDKRKWLSEISLVNPKIVEKSEGTDVELEACLSFPGMEGKVRRHKWIKVEAQNADGKKIKKKYTGWTARVFQHEYDHLEGVVYVDRLEEDADKETVKPVLDDLAKAYKEETGDEGAPELKF